MLPHWFWRVRFRTPQGGGETLVVAPHPAGAKQSVASGVETITAYEDIDPRGRVPPSAAAQHFDGYYPGVQAAFDTSRELAGSLR